MRIGMTLKTAAVLGLAALIGFGQMAFAMGLVSIGALGAALWWLGRCHHPRPLALLPPTSTADGIRIEAQWFCAGCGRTWPVALEHGHAPVQRFAGYDESKAPEAAKRARALENRRREMAIQRAGLAKGPSPVRRPVDPPVRINRPRAVS